MGGDRRSPLAAGHWETAKRSFERRYVLVGLRWSLANVERIAYGIALVGKTDQLLTDLSGSRCGYASKIAWPHSRDSADGRNPAARERSEANGKGTGVHNKRRQTSCF